MQEVSRGDVSRRLWIVLIKSAHSGILLLMSATIVYVLYSAVTGTRGGLLWVALGLLVGECVAFLGGRARCPLTNLAKRLGDASGNDYLSDWLLPRELIRYTVPTCGGLFALGLLMLLLSSLPLIPW
jgi:hypothetical protein